MNRKSSKSIGRLATDWLMFREKKKTRSGQYLAGLSFESVRIESLLSY